MPAGEGLLIGESEPMKVVRAMIDRLQEHRAAGRDVYAYFKHEDTPHGALYAVEVLKELAAAA